MRGWIGEKLGPVFESVVSRFDPAVEIEAHFDFARSVIAQWPSSGDEVDRYGPAFGLVQGQLQIDQAHGVAMDADPETSAWDPSIQLPTRAIGKPREASEMLPMEAVETIGQQDAWQANPRPASRAAAALLSALADEDWALRHAHSVACHALLALPPSKWFLFKRGSFFGSSQLLDFLIGVCERSPEMRGDLGRTGDPVHDGTIEVLDRLIRHVEVRRGDALRFVPDSIAGNDDPVCERLHFTISLIRASALFSDLRYLNTAMKLLDAALVEIGRVPFDPQNPYSLRRHIVYLLALVAQESRLREVLTP
jgi:hypothetical protein